MVETNSMEKAAKYLKSYFGHSDFREEQYRVIKEVLKGRNMLVIMSTGKGK